MFLLKELRKESGLKRSDLAKQLNMNQNTLANYEKELRQAPYETLIAFADYFSVSVDELLGRNPSNDVVESNADFAPVGKKEKEIIAAYRKLDDDNKHRMIDYLNLLILAQNANE